MRSKLSKVTISRRIKSIGHGRYRASNRKRHSDQRHPRLSRVASIDKRVTARVELSRFKAEYIDRTCGEEKTARTRRGQIGGCYLKSHRRTFICMALREER